MVCCKVLLVLVGAVFMASPAAAQYKFVSQWLYSCDGEGTPGAHCVRHLKHLDNATLLMTLTECKLTCFSDGPVWPRPTGNNTFGTELSKFTFSQVFDSMTSSHPSVEQEVTYNMKLFRQHLNMYHPDYNFHDETAPWTIPSDTYIKEHKLQVIITVSSEEKYLSLLTDESYTLMIITTNKLTTATITAVTFFGARHGLESLSQLIDYDEENNCLQIVNDVMIENDSPVFPYRGLIIDTARNFIPIKDIERTIDAMAANKLNTFHWHITDTNAIPMVFESLPQMNNYGAESSRALFQPAAVRQLVEYARMRGVRVVPEIDAPAHVGNGWQWGPEYGLGDLAVCVNQEPWMSYCVQPPCGQLNIANAAIYGVLQTIYQDLVALFQPLDLYHFGGDEINLNCWNTTVEIVNWMATVGDGSLTEDAYYQQWSIFHNKSFDSFKEANGKDIQGIIWSSHLTQQGRADKYLDKNKYIVQIWTSGDDPIIKELLEKKFRIIFSNYDAWYLDCGFGAWVGEGNNWCSPYKGWQMVYDNNPLDLAGSPDYHDQVVGGEAALWSEQVSGASMDAKLWPRAAALAERLWTNPTSGWGDAEHRMIHHRQRMTVRGIAAERLQPEWCHQNAGSCYLDPVEDKPQLTTTTTESNSDSLIPSCLQILFLGTYTTIIQYWMI